MGFNKNLSTTTLETLLTGVEQPKDRVYIISEVGYDTHYFDEDSYNNLIAFMKQDPALGGIIVDGALTRLDRPEYFNDALSYWERDAVSCQHEARSIPNNLQYHTLLERQLNILKSKLVELRASFPEATIVFNCDTDDFQFTLSALINEAMLRKVQEIDNQINHLKEKRNQYRQEMSDIRKENKKDTLTSDMKDRQVQNLEQRLSNIGEEISECYTQKNLWREKKVRPAHQLYTRELLAEVYNQFELICSPLRVDLITKPTTLKFGDLSLNFNHSSERSWAVKQAPDEGYVGSSLETLRRAKQEVVDVIVESGHHGRVYKQLQKLYDHERETNFQNQSSSLPHIGQDTITIVFALPFENQLGIARYGNGYEQVRLSGGKPMGTRKYAAIDRLVSGGVSGITVIDKDKAGLVGTEWISYSHFVQGVPSSCSSSSLVVATSDEHIGSPEENIMVRHAMTVLFNHLVENPLVLRSTMHYACGFISGGDTAEANSKKWNHRYHYRPDPLLVLSRNLVDLTSFDSSSKENIFQLLHQFTSDARSGSVEDMSVILGRVADYYETYLNISLTKSSLQLVHLSVPGNHADGVLVDCGFRESDFFVQRLQARGVPLFQVGRLSSLEEARVAVGGYSSARILQIPEYGLSTTGEALFGPINLLIQHDPKGSRSSGLVGAARAAKADLALAGHTHETYVKTFNVGLNNFGIAYRLATLQGTTPTEKYYAASPPRTQAGHLFIMPTPGHFYEKTLPAPYLEKIAIAELVDKIERN